MIRSNRRAFTCARVLQLSLDKSESRPALAFDADELEGKSERIFARIDEHNAQKRAAGVSSTFGSRRFVAAVVRADRRFTLRSCFDAVETRARTTPRIAGSSSDLDSYHSYHRRRSTSDVPTQCLMRETTLCIEQRRARATSTTLNERINAL